MTDNETRPLDEAAQAELKGVPEELIDSAGNGEELAKLREELEAAKQDARYTMSVTQNLRRRMEKDIADLRDDEKFKNLVAGLEATGREIEKVFAGHGISRIAATGLPLDPHQHQAMMEVPSADAEPGTVLQELQAGYMIKDRLLRPAMVAVAKKPD